MANTMQIKCINWVAERRHAGHQFRDEATSQRSQRQTPMGRGQSLACRGC